MVSSTSVLRMASAASRTPLIQFLGKNRIPATIDHSPRPHPQSPNHSLPSSFAEYRKVATQHGPLANGSRSSSRPSLEVKPGEYFDRNDLPKRFWRMTLSEEECELLQSGGASAWA